MDDYHGWILGYKANDLNQQLIRYITTPNDERGGIWMSGAGLAADASGNIYYANGNANNSSLANSPDNVGLSVVKVAPDLPNQTLHNVSWLKPLSYTTYNTSDLDFGTGVITIPGTNMLVTAHKTGKLFVMKQNATPGEFNENSTNFLQSILTWEQPAAQDRIPASLILQKVVLPRLLYIYPVFRKHTCSCVCGKYQHAKTDYATH